MNVLIFGATGMVGQGVLRECLIDPDVERVVCVGRTSTGQQHPKLRELIRSDPSDLSALESELAGLDTCFFCLGVSAAGMSEERYTSLTYDLTMRVAESLARSAPGMTFLYVSGMGTDSSERGRAMWARVKGRTENALLRLPFKRAYMIRPGFIVPMHGITSRTALYRITYRILGPFFPLMRRFLPGAVTTTETLGRAMITVGKTGYAAKVLETRDINAVVKGRGVD
jgi:uncharacterized protein YbjT (DUF2867 family)